MCGAFDAYDEQMAAAMIDRLVHHGHLLIFDGESYRMKHALMRQTQRPPADKGVRMAASMADD